MVEQTTIKLGKLNIWKPTNIQVQKIVFYIVPVLTNRDKKDKKRTYEVCTYYDE